MFYRIHTFPVVQQNDMALISYGSYWFVSVYELRLDYLSPQEWASRVILHLDHQVAVLQMP